MPSSVIREGSNPLFQPQASWSMTSKRAEDNLMVVRNLLEKPIDENTSKAEQKAQVNHDPD